jgi:hypothetical protein
VRLGHTVTPALMQIMRPVAPDRRLATDSQYRRFVLRGNAHDRIFAITLFRMLLAYRTGAMRYAVLTAAKATDWTGGLHPYMADAEPPDDEAKKLMNLRPVTDGETPFSGHDIRRVVGKNRYQG